MRILILLSVISFSMIACQELDKFTQFDLEYNASVTVPASSGINLPFNLFSPDITSNSQQQFAVNDTRKDLIEEIYLKQLHLTVTSPAGEDFSFLEEVQVYIDADGLPEVEIATKTPVPTSAGVMLSLDCSQTDIKEHIKKDKFSLRLRTVTDEFLSNDHIIDVNAIFFVDAKILGL